MLLHALPRETLISAKEAINDELQGSRVVNNQIKKGLLLSPWVKKKIGEYLAKLLEMAAMDYIVFV